MSRRSTVLLLSQLNVAKVLNVFALGASFCLSRILRRAYHAGAPMSISIEPTTSCNLRCPECPSGLRAFTRPTGMLTLPAFQKILQSQNKALAAITFYFQGEPFLNPELLTMVREASIRKIFTTTSTNGHYLHDQAARAIVESGLHRLIVSVDGTTQEVYSQYRIGGSLEKVLEGIRKVLKWKTETKSSFPEVILQFIVFKQNEHQIDEVLKLGNDLGVEEVRLKTAQVYDYEKGNQLIPENEKYARYLKTSQGSWKLKNRMSNHCWRMWQGCVFTWDGKVLPCCFDKDADNQLGSIEELSFKKIWKGKAYRNFRQAILSGRDQIEICKNCTEGGKVWI
ncbi:MAG: SPASM domain-containing protein [Bacteroidia bacterium]|jgi:radical SAM protein with 4Fe4S-binding SPASM domain|nr:SPASM domain-containing protein [Bacteroidia bacterium]MCC6768696.1 SPASM domain-containing protein [Bacteroidia bacterium]